MRYALLFHTFMKHWYLGCSHALLALSLLASCHRSEPTPAGPPPSITGSVQVRTQQNQFLSAAGVTVTVAGSQPVVSAITSQDGRFELPSLPAGSYNLQFSRAGLSSFALLDVPHPKADSTTRLTNTFTLAEEPTLQATDLAVVPTTRTDEVRLKMTVRSPQPITDYTRLVYVSTSPTVSMLNTRLCLALFGGSTTPSTIITATWDFDRADLQRGGYKFASGTKLYAVLYGAGPFASQYIDPATSSTMTWYHPNLTPSQVVSFTMP